MTLPKPEAKQPRLCNGKGQKLPIDNRPVKAEYTGWRDQKLSARHRTTWGFDMPMVDIDLLVAEYDKCIPIALVEYKWETHTPRLSGANYQVLRELANRANIPFFVCGYKGDLTRWYLYPANKLALKVLPSHTDYTEEEYVTFLYQLKGLTIPENIRVLLK